LILLAVLSTVGGFMNVPEALSGGSWLGKFLEPVFAGSVPNLAEHHLEHSTEYALMGTVVALTVVLIAIAYSIYVRSQKLPAGEDQPLGPIHNLAYHKYYVDEIYNT